MHGGTVEKRYLFTSPASPPSGQGARVFVTVLKRGVLAENSSYGKEIDQEAATIGKRVHYTQLPREAVYLLPGSLRGKHQARSGAQGEEGTVRICL